MSTLPLLAHTRVGQGEPLVLLHGLGSSRSAWNPVLPLLQERFDVSAIDLPGFGESEPLPEGLEPSPAVLAAVVARTLADLDVQAPHVAGNSLGGWTALELAALIPVRSLTLLSPAGLWRDRTPTYTLISLWTTRFMARHLHRLLRPLLRFRLARSLVFFQVVGRPMRMSPTEAHAAVNAMALCQGFRLTVRATRLRAFVARAEVEAPVSISFGTRDRILRPRQSRHLDQLPSHTRVVRLRGTGHVPMTDDPLAVASLISRTADSSTINGAGLGQWTKDGLTPRSAG